MKKTKIIVLLYITGSFLFSLKATSQNVNEFTGGFSYSVPLITVPSPYGSGVSIGASYGAGIGVNQSASEIGLGWDINLGGAISRSVSGVPDDWNNVRVADPMNAGFKTQAGVMYLNSNADNLDFYKSTYKIDTSAFHFPDYDSYSICGPGISGSLTPHLFDFATIKMNVQYNTNLPATKYAVDDVYKFKRPLQFNFGNDYAGNFKSRHYPTTPINGSTVLRYPGYNDAVTDAEYTNKNTPYVGVGLLGFDTLTNRLATAKYVTYSNNEYGISGFTITDEAGFVYTYSIPVYIRSTTYGNYPLNNEYMPKVYNGIQDTLRVETYWDGYSSFMNALGNYYIQDSALTNGGKPFMVEWKQNVPYASHWLLTSVKGPDYVDTDAGNTVTDADKGYWVTYDWQKWTSNFIKRIPEYGFNYSFNADENDNTKDLTITDANKISGKYGTFTKYEQDVYYLNKVRTASHTAIMVRDVRLDECSSDAYNYDNQQASSTTHPVVAPQLKLSRIVLFKNENFATLNTVASNTAYNISTTEVAFSLPSSKNLFYNENWYNHANNKTAIESKSLQTVEFKQDYSLARKYVSNVKTRVQGTNKLSNPSDVVNGITVPAADYASSGKLTLNEIVTYNAGHIKTLPSVLFDYNKSITTDNPNYNPVKIDYSGFYKSDATAKGYSSYTTSFSKDSTDAWSLRKITSPMGGITEINYESNQYEKVLDGKGGFRGPSKMYMIKSISRDWNYNWNWNYNLEDDVSDFTELKNSLPSTGIVKHCFIPYIDTVYNGHFFKFIDSDVCTFLGSSGLYGETYYYSINSRDYFEDNTISNYFTNGGSNLKYTGNGYIHFSLPVGMAAYGGGVRVKSIVTKNGTTDAYTQEYSYSGGVTPMEFDRFAEEKKLPATATGGYAHYIKLRPAQYDYHRMGPGIGYTAVTVKNKGQNNITNGSHTTTFITSDAGIDNFKISPIQFKSSANTHCICSCLGGPTCEPSYCSAYLDTTYMIEVVDKFSGYWGQVKETQTADMNDNVLSKTVNIYSTLNQGSLVENYDFLTIKDHVAIGGGSEPSTITCSQYDHTICIKRRYPVILSKQTQYAQGISATTEYLTFDAITGSATKVRTTSPNKGTTVTTTAPAFRNSQYAGMGPKSVLATNANILSPSYYSRTTVDSTITNTADFGNYSVQTFKKNFNVRIYDVTSNAFKYDPQTNLYWIADKNYSWAGDSTSLSNHGLFKQSNFTAFDYTLANVNKKWRLGIENTLLDKSGHILETKGFNNRFNATKYGYGDTLQIAQAGNVNYPSFTYCGFESAIKDLDPGIAVANYMEGEVKLNAGIKSAAVVAHTGNYVLQVPAGTTGANSPAYAVKYISGVDENKGLLKDRTYRASVWVHSSSAATAQLSVSFTGIAAQSIAKSNATNITIGNWTLMNVDITIPATPANGQELKVYLESTGGNAYFDDLRLHPVDAAMNATVYDTKTNRVAATLDGNNFATKYVYNAAGIAIEVWQEIEGLGLKQIKKTRYNYARGLQ